MLIVYAGVLILLIIVVIIVIKSRKQIINQIIPNIQSKEYFDTTTTAHLLDLKCAKNGWYPSSVLNEKKNDHLWIVNRAINILAQDTTSEASLQISRLLANNSIYHDAMARGIYDVAHINPYHANETWLSHYYNPKTQTTYYPGQD